MGGVSHASDGQPRAGRVVRRLGGVGPRSSVLQVLLAPEHILLRQRPDISLYSLSHLQTRAVLVLLYPINMLYLDKVQRGVPLTVLSAIARSVIHISNFVS